MRELLSQLAARLPLQFRVLYRQFLLRVIDLEALSIEADIPRFLAQFAGLLIVYSAFQGLSFIVTVGDPRMTLKLLAMLEWRLEQGLISTMLLAVGMMAVASWESAFPDRRDAMVLAPLPVRPRTILMAKLAAAGAMLAVAVASLTAFSSAALSWVMGNASMRFFTVYAAFWVTMMASGLFLYCSLLVVQGATALLPRRLALRVSSALQLAAFGVFPAVYIIEPVLLTPAQMMLAKNHWAIACTPSFWFFAMLNQLNGTLPSGLDWLAWRAWIGLGAAVIGAVAALLLCYLRTMKKIVEQPDLVPAARGLHWAPRFGGRIRTTVLLFSVRSVTRNRQHRLVFAFFVALVLWIALAWIGSDLSASALRPLSAGFLVSTLLIVCLAVFGLRAVFSLPVSLTANWVWRIAQLDAPGKYIAAARATLIVLAVVPAWLLSAGLSFVFRPLAATAAHLVLLALLGCIAVEIALIGLCKIPFTCSFVPEKTNVQFAFWGFAIVFGFGFSGARIELESLGHPFDYAAIFVLLVCVEAGLWLFNRVQARDAVLYYEEQPYEVVTRLGLIVAPSQPANAKPLSRKVEPVN